MSGQGKALILLVTDQMIQLLVWSRHSLALLRDFHNTHEDQEVLLRALRGYPDFPVLIVADLIDESFRHDHIVHVTGADRTALIKRKLDFAFRNTQYRIGRIKGRERDGRRLDKLLMAAINKPEAVDTWTALLLEEKRPIQAVTSMAWLLRDYVALQKLDKENTLLIVNLEPGNNLRQSFFQTGKLLFSRLTNLNNRTSNELAGEIYQETLQVRQYLERIQFVEYEAPLLIHVLTTLPAGELDLQDRSTGINHFEVIECGDDVSAIGMQEGNEGLGPMHAVLAQVLRKKQPVNIYGPPEVTRYHDLLQLGRYVAVAAGLVLCVGLIANLPLALGVKEKWEQAEVFNARTSPLQRQYTELSDNFPATPIPSSEMALIVEAYDRLADQTFSPVVAMNMVSAALARTDGVVLTNIDWQLVENTLPPPAADGTAPSTQPLSGVTPETAFTGLILQRRAHMEVVLNGQAYSANSFREAQDQVETFVIALSENPGVSVFASRMPTDVRTDIAVSTTVGDGEVRAPFTLELTLPVAPASAPQVAAQP
jgi:hypothetical protein